MMFFEEVSEILEIAGRVSTAIFVVPDETLVEIPKAILLEPEGKSVITIEQVREVLARLTVKQTTDRFIVIRPAEKLGLDAANALLKSLEEPAEKVHFVLITSRPSELLSTILSRAAVYFLRTKQMVDSDILADAKTRELAKRLIVAKPTELVALAEEICKKKEGVREHALNILGVTIEMLYKSYFKTGNQAFLKKLPRFLTAYENIARNGHIKLHLVADLI